MAVQLLDDAIVEHVVVKPISSPLARSPTPQHVPAKPRIGRFRRIYKTYATSGGLTLRLRHRNLFRSHPCPQLSHLLFINIFLKTQNSVGD